MDEGVPVRSAASVVLVRERQGEVEVLLTGRPQTASFVPGAYVFPGGAAEEGEELRTCAARELFEECGILFSQPLLDATGCAHLRAGLAKRRSFVALLESVGARLQLDPLICFARWITPSTERKRFDAWFFLAAAPEGSEPVIDPAEVSQAVWISLREALAARVRMRLVPPQVHILTNLANHAADGIGGLFAWARTQVPFPILPRLAVTPRGKALLLPWDPEYGSLGTGDARSMPAGVAGTLGPSRFVLDEARGWHMV
jgi:8-oxo-dGTP pyrophosphatase MutT (NUDIX family)